MSGDIYSSGGTMRYSVPQEAVEPAWFDAMRRSSCVYCPREIRPGDQVIIDEGGLRHLKCPSIWWWLVLPILLLVLAMGVMAACLGVLPVNSGGTGGTGAGVTPAVSPEEARYVERGVPDAGVRPTPGIPPTPRIW